MKIEGRRWNGIAPGAVFSSPEPRSVLLRVLIDIDGAYDQGLTGKGPDVIFIRVVLTSFVIVLWGGKAWRTNSMDSKRKFSKSNDVL